MNAKQNTNANFINGAVWLTVSTLILKIIGLIYKIPLSYMLGDEGMGYFNTAYTVYVFFYVVGTAGIPKAISIITAKSEAEYRDSSNEILRVAFGFFFFAGVVLLAVFAMFGESIAGLVGNSKAAYAIYSIAPSILFVCASGVIRGFLSGQMRFGHIAISELISGVIKLVFGLLLAEVSIRAGKSLPVVAAYTILGVTIGTLASCIYLLSVSARDLKKRSVSTSNPREILRSILKIAIPITCASAIGSLVNILDLTLIMNGLEGDGYDSGIANVLYGNYSTLALPMLSTVSTVISPITTAMLPLFAAGFSRDDKTDFNDRMVTAFSLCTFVCTPAAFYFAFFSQQMLQLIFEDGSAVLGAPMLMLLAPATMIIGPLTVMNTALEAAGKPSVAFVSLTLGAAIKLVVSFLLLRLGNVGILAASIGTSASYIISYTVSRIYLGNIRDVKCPIFSTSLAPIIASFGSVLICELCLKILDFKGNFRLHNAFLFVIFSISYLLLTLMISKKGRNVLFKCVKINKKRTNDL